MKQQYGWSITNAGAGTLSVVKPSVAGKSHIIFTIGINVRDAGAVRWEPELLDGTTVVWQGTIPNTIGQFEAITFPRGISCAKGAAVTLQMAAGSGGFVFLNLHGITVG